MDEYFRYKRNLKKKIKSKSVKLSSHICDTTRHDSMRHDTTEDQDTTVFKFGATHITTRPCDLILIHKLYDNFVVYS